MKSLSTILVLTLLPTIALAGGKHPLITVESQHDVPETTQRLAGILESKGMTIFNTIDHQANAKKVEMSLPPTTLILFGNPKMGSTLMACQQSIGIDLPMKFLVSEVGGKVTIAYNSPKYLKKRHKVKGSDAAFEKMTGVLAAIAAAAGTN